MLWTWHGSSPNNFADSDRRDVSINNDVGEIAGCHAAGTVRIEINKRFTHSNPNVVISKTIWWAHEADIACHNNGHTIYYPTCSMFSNKCVTVRVIDVLMESLHQQEFFTCKILGEYLKLWKTEDALIGWRFCKCFWSSPLLYLFVKIR